MANEDSTARRGIHIAGDAFEAIHFAFRTQDTSDFGIDAHVEPRQGTTGSGELIALQIKAGESYVREAADNGWWLRTNARHAGYWLQHALPVVLVHVDVGSGRVVWQAVTERTVIFTGVGAKILIPRDQEVNAASSRALRDILWPGRLVGAAAATGADCRVFLGRGISGRPGWHQFAKTLARHLRQDDSITGWDILVDARTTEEDDHLTSTNEYGDDAEDLVSIVVDRDRRRATYFVSVGEVDDMNVMWNVESKADAAADSIVQHLAAADGLVEDEPYDNDDNFEDLP